MRNSRRGDVDPFIVMDVMQAARAAEAAGRRIVHMEVGQPGTPAPAGARAALAAAMEAGALGYTVALGLPALRARIAALYRDRHGIDAEPRAGDRHPGLVGRRSSWPSPRSSTPATGSGLGLPGYPSYRHILKALSLDPVGIATRAAGPLAAGRRGPAGRPRRADRRLAGQPLRHHAGPRRRSRALIDWAEATGAAFVSDEIYHGIDYGFRPVSALEITRRGLGDQLVLEVLVDDRLADRLDGGARARDPAGRAAGAEPVHLPAARKPGRGAGGDGLRAPNCRPTWRSMPQNRAADAGAVCRKSGSPASRRPTGRSTSMPMSRT